jgi:hypothetical protein
LAAANPISASSSSSLASRAAPLRWVRLHLARMREEGELELPFEPRCRVCRNPDLRKTVNQLLSRGFTLSAILASLESVNAALPPIWRRIQEQRAAESGVDYGSGIVSLVNAAQLPRDDDAQGVRDAG